MNILRAEALRMQTALLDLGFEECQLSFIVDKCYVETSDMTFDRKRGVRARLVASFDSRYGVRWAQASDPLLKHRFNDIYDKIKHVVLHQTTQGMP